MTRIPVVGVMGSSEVAHAPLNDRVAHYNFKRQRSSAEWGLAVRRRTDRLEALARTSETIHCRQYHRAQKLHVTFNRAA